MSEEVKRVKKEEVIVKEVVELKIELSADFFDKMSKAKSQVAEARGFDVSYGAYMEEAMDDMVLMIAQMQDQIMANAARAELPEVVDNNANEKSDEDKAAEQAAMEQMYGHISKSGKDDPMFL